MTTERLIRWLALMVASCGCLDATAESEKPLTVCEILDHLAKYDGKMVRVRGQAVVGSEQSSLSPHACKLVSPPSARGLADGIWTAQPGQWDPARAVTFKVDRESQRRAREFVDKIVAEGTPGVILVTVTGMVDAVRTLIPPKGPGPIRYGHLGMFPAMLIVKEFADLKFVPKE